jgi:branched-chain amino acid aminotransferase
MKAYKALPSGSRTDETTNTSTSDIRLFRPDKNMERLSNSMARLQMPGADFDRDQLIQCIAELVRIDQQWIPVGAGYSLYLRPTVISTTTYLGVSAPNSLLLYVMCCPVGPYYTSGFRPVKLTADTPYVRAWPGGTGGNKVGGNYAGTMKAQDKATAEGYGQVLWLMNDEVTEVGSMNVFFVFRQDDGGMELVTPPLDRGDILPGVTRDSILHLARTRWSADMIVSERFPTMTEIQAAAANGTLLEAFGAGTAAVVTPIGSIQYRGQDIGIPTTPTNGSSGTTVTQRVWDELTGIQYGTIEGPPGWSVRI